MDTWRTETRTILISFRFSFNLKKVTLCVRRAHVSKSRASGHDCGLVDGHRIFGVVGNDGVSGLVVGCDFFILLVDFNALPLGA